MGMTIDEVIERFKSNAEYERTHGNLQGCLEFRQLAEWLQKYQMMQADYNARLKAELKEIREEIKQLPTFYIEVQRPHSIVKRDVVELGMVCIILDKKISELEGDNG